MGGSPNDGEASAIEVSDTFLSRNGGGTKTDMNIQAKLLTTTRSKQFNYKELKIATNWLHSSQIIGHGAFRPVYKAFLTSSGNATTMKRSRHSHKGKTEFLEELSIISYLRHKHLMPLQEWCVEKGELFVYEFMPHENIDKVLY